MLPPHGQRGDSGHACTFLQHLRCGSEQAGITSKLVEHKALNALLVFWGQQRPGTVQVCKSSAAVNIGHQQATGVGVPSDTQVDDVAVHQVDFCGRACAFNDNHIVFSDQLIQRCRNVWPDLFAATAPRRIAQLRAHLPQQDHLAARVSLRLEQQRVHADIGLSLRRQRLKILCAADLTHAICAGYNPCVVAHVLRLEGRHLESLARVMSTQGRGQPALACPAGCAQHHDATRCHAGLP